MSTSPKYPIAVQRHILVSIGVNNQITYTYIDYQGVLHTGIAQCDLSIIEPTYTLFLLDGPSARNGWTITEVTGDYPKTPFEYQLGSFGLSVGLYDDYTAPAHYPFSIVYLNTSTGVIIPVDPQETNIPIH